jgi:hypothetical protein
MPKYFFKVNCALKLSFITLSSWLGPTPAAMFGPGISPRSDLHPGPDAGNVAVQGLAPGLSRFRPIALKNIKNAVAAPPLPVPNFLEASQQRTGPVVFETSKLEGVTLPA